jgi:peptidoglycan/LPS O-acetylase OafA/YrhL
MWLHIAPISTGLRAVAIGAVLLFPRLSGAFSRRIGVGIFFFVISGFLITGNINRRIEGRLLPPACSANFSSSLVS